MADGAFVAEGAKLLDCALDAHASVEAVYVAAGALSTSGVRESVERAMSAGARAFELAPGVLEKIADTVTPQPVLAVVRTPEASFDDVADADLVIVCVDVRDPGNAGALIRSADASGAGGVVCCDGTVDPYNPKTVRASAGSVLHVPVITGVERPRPFRWLGVARTSSFAARSRRRHPAHGCRLVATLGSRPRERGHRSRRVGADHSSTSS